MRTIAIVDDHPIMASAISDALARSAQRVESAVIDPSDPDAEQQLLELAPELCLLDLDLGLEPAAGLRFLRTTVPAGIPTVMLTGTTDEVLLGRCIEAGALGIIGKMQAFGDVIASIERALAGEPCSSDTDLLRWVLAAQRHDGEQERLMRPFEALTKREATVLQHLVEGNRVDQIAEAEFVAVATIRSQVRSILQKLDVQSQLAAVAIARRADWSYEREAV